MVDTSIVTGPERGPFRFFKEKIAEIQSRLKHSELAAASLRGSILSVSGFSAQKALQLISNLVLARLLFPEAFGLMALASVFLLGISMFSDLGINASIVQSRRGNEEKFLNTAWTLMALRGVAIALIACLLAWPVARIYNQPILFPLLCALSSTAIIQGVASTAIATQNRNLVFKKIIAIDLAKDLLTTAITIAFAFWWRSVWALAVGAISGNLIRTVLSHWILPSHKLRLTLDKDCAGEIFRFGRWILLATLVNFIGGHGLPLIQGYLVSLETLGLLAIAKTFVQAIQDLTAKLMNTVVFPVLSRLIREQPGSLRNTVTKVRILSNGLAMAAYLGLSVISAPLIGLLYDDRYAQAGGFLTILAFNGALGFMEMLYQNVQLARGASRIHFYVMSAMAITRTTGLLVGFQIGGIYGMLYGLCAGSLATYLVSFSFAHIHRFSCFKTDLVTLVIIGILMVVTLK